MLPSWVHSPRGSHAPGIVCKYSETADMWQQPSPFGNCTAVDPLIKPDTFIIFNTLFCLSANIIILENQIVCLTLYFYNWIIHWIYLGCTVQFSLYMPD